MKNYLLVCAALCGASFAPGAILTYTAVLSGSQEVPTVVSTGSGNSTVIYNDVAHTLRVIVTFANLTSATTNAHIHCCAAFGTNAGVATQTPTFAGFPAGVTSGSYDNTFDLTQASSWNPTFITNNGGTTASAEAALATGLAQYRAYLNIHTSAFTGGEIRGQLVPEPSTMLLGALALVLAGVRRTRS